MSIATQLPTEKHAGSLRRRVGAALARVAAAECYQDKTRTGGFITGKPALPSGN